MNCLDEYRRECRAMVAEAESETMHPRELVAIAETCVVRPDSLIDWAPLLAWVRRDQVQSPWLIAAVLNRNGRFDESLELRASKDDTLEQKILIEIAERSLGNSTATQFDLDDAQVQQQFGWDWRVKFRITQLYFELQSLQ
ncbi:MAG: hypothetical protein R3C28_03050 [Pirellulaceae bacterium]